MSKLRIASLAIGILLVVVHFVAKAQLGDLETQAVVGADGSTQDIDMIRVYGQINSIALLGGIALVLYSALGIGAKKTR